MSVKTVALDAEAYEMLRRRRRPRETFGDTVKRLSGPARSILEFAGSWKEMPPDELATIRRFFSEGRRRDRERMERLRGPGP